MLKIGLIGCGFMGSMHLNCYLNIPDVKVVAIADVRSEKAAEAVKLSGAKSYKDGKELIANADVDVIDICLPTFLHAEHALLAMDKVKYVFIEKPVALTVEQGRALIEKMNSTGARVQVGQVIRFWDEYVELKKIVDSKVYGNVVSANFRRLSPVPTWGWDGWLTDPVRSGGAGQDLHIHDIDYVLSLFSKPNTFYSVKNTLAVENDYVCTLMKYDDFVVSVEGTWGLPESYPFTASFRVVFEDAVVENDKNGFVVYKKDKMEKLEIEKVALDTASDSGGNISDLGGYYNELVYFTSKAAKGEEIENATLCQAVASLEFLMGELNF